MVWHGESLKPGRPRDMTLRRSLLVRQYMRDHDLRSVLNDELHGRPGLPVVAPARITHLAFTLTEGDGDPLEQVRVLCDALGIPLPCPDELIGSLASVPIPDATDATPSKNPLYLDALQERLLAESGIEVPVVPWPAPPKRLLRISAQLYNSLPQYERLAGALKRLL